MPIEIKFIIFQAVIIAPFTAGVLLKKKFQDPAALSKKIITFNLILIEPVIIFWSIWGLIIDWNYFYLPLAGLSTVIAGFFLGKLSLPILDLSGRSRATFLISSSISNSGFTMGGFICYLLEGAKGLGLSFLYILFFIPYTFIFIFNYARHHSGTGGRFSLKKSTLTLQNLPLLASVAAIILSVAGIKRPNIDFPLDPFITVSIALYYFTTGLNIFVKDISPFRIEHLILSAIKFIIIPATTYMVLQFTNLDNDVERIILIQSFMPAAVYSVITSILFDLDTKLASSMFIINTAIFIIVVIPLLFMLRSAMAI